MKKIGIIGGLGPESTLYYYQQITSLIRQKTGEYPEIILYSANLSISSRLLEVNDLSGYIAWMSFMTDSLVKAGAEFIAIASNTPHIILDPLQNTCSVPIISIVKETAREAQKCGLKKALLLGTKFTMQAKFYPDVFASYGIEVIVPDSDAIDFIQEKIFSELEFGTVKDITRNKFLDIIQQMKEQHSIDSVILGCTELFLIMDHECFDLHFLNTTQIHIESIVNYALK
ncbi:MAG: amino acid racemase [Bacteroidota bacterium]|nr:amino acid racemase [Bacteroidota bacterium]MDP4227706.1 amino acid racemase [Bacteroidota bacterium]MDP4273693.1 amino acid racemase [Bacteroidota bacterium]